MKYILCLIVFFFCSLAFAHPVIYKGGWVYWGSFSNSSFAQRVSYTLHPRVSIEINSQNYKALKVKLDDGVLDSRHYNLIQLGANVLAKRWLFQESQGNIYLSLSGGFGGGVFPLKESDSGSLWSLGSKHFSFLEKVNNLGLVQSSVEADWESRKLYTALSLKAYYPLAEKEFWPLSWSWRAGFAPYTAGMNELQTWLVFQFDYFKKMEKPLKITPIFRFFYKTALWEVGSSFAGDFFLTLMIHY